MLIVILLSNEILLVARATIASFVYLLSSSVMAAKTRFDEIGYSNSSSGYSGGVEPNYTL